MRVCQIVPSLEERYGGPSKSVYALSRALADCGQDVSLLATHPDAPISRIEGSLRVEIFRRGVPGFLCPSRGLRSHLQTMTSDIVHHHSIWLRTLHYAHRDAVRRNAPLVISPRGMVSAWAWAHHGRRKQWVRRLVHPGALEAAAGWHATSAGEAEEIRALGFNQPICIAPNGVSAPTAENRATSFEYWQRRCPDVSRHRTALFYSRFHRKKRVLELIDLWLQQAPRDWILLMVGLPDDYSIAQLENYVMRASGAGRVHIFDGQGRPPPYAVSSLFLLPSHSENYGLSIAEAMAHRLPVVVTDTTPWSEVNKNAAGWCGPWERYADALREALDETDVQLALRGQEARDYVLANFSWASSAASLNSFYRQLLESHARKSVAAPAGR